MGPAKSKYRLNPGLSKLKSFSPLFAKALCLKSFFHFSKSVLSFANKLELKKIESKKKF